MTLSADAGDVIRTAPATKANMRFIGSLSRLDQSALNASNFGASGQAAIRAQKPRLLQTKQARRRNLRRRLFGVIPERAERRVSGIHNHSLSRIAPIKRHRTSGVYGFRAASP
jgi:hypothetical protein